MNDEQKLIKIKEFAKMLKFSYCYNNMNDFIQEYTNLNSKPIDVIFDMLQNEFDVRTANGKQNRIRYACFPYKKLLSDLNIDYLPNDAKEKLSALETLEFIKGKRNLILSGNPGTGKTHIAIGLGIKACMEGYKVLFCSVSSLIVKFKESKNEKTLNVLQRQLENYDLLILDELGYISFDREGGELLFSLLSLRSERKSTIITTNLSFEKWEEVFKDPIVTTAIIDRLTHKSYVINMNGNSYRLKETKEMINLKGGKLSEQ